MTAVPEAVKSSSPEEQVVKVATIVSASAMFLVVLLGLCSIFLPWWTGAVAVRNVSTEVGLGATITLWDHELRVSTPISPDSPERHERLLESDWAIWCEAEELRTRSWPMACVTVNAARFFAIITPILAIFAVVAQLCGLFEPLLLLAGAGLALLAGFCALSGVVCGLITATAGLVGAGFFLLVTCMVLSLFSTAATLYAAAKAMPLEDPGDGKSEHNSRIERSTVARQRATVIAQQLEDNTRKSRALAAEQRKGGSKPSSSPTRKKPVALQKVIEWTHSHGTDESQQIPVDLLEKAFRELDRDGSGNVGQDEMVAGLEACGLRVSQAASATVLSEIDKNNSGDIDVHEFVEFFRHIEELNRFSHKTQQRAQFLSFICSACFLAHIVIVGVLLMLFIQMDEAESGEDNYSIMQNALIVFSIILCLLFVSVIGIPAAKLTLGPNIAAWRRYYDRKFFQGKKKRPGASQATKYECRFKCGFKGALAEVQAHEKQCQARGNQPLPAGGLRDAAWGDLSFQEAVTVNAALFGSSYRVRKAQAELAKINRDYKECPNGCGFSGTHEEVDKHEFICLLRRRNSVASTESGAAEAPPPPGVILNSDGGMDRYDPLSFRLEQMNQMGHRTPQTFVAMASRDTAQNPTAGADTNSGMLALDNGTINTSLNIPRP